MNIQDMLTPAVTPPQAREAINRILTTLVLELGSDIKYIGDLLALLRALAPADYTQIMRTIDRLAHEAEFNESSASTAPALVSEPEPELSPAASGSSPKAEAARSSKS